MDRFLEKFNLPRLNQEAIEIMNNPVTSTEIEAMINKSPKNKSPGPDGFSGEFFQTVREELTPILSISNFLEEISSLFHSIIFLYFFALIT